MGTIKVTTHAIVLPNGTTFGISMMVDDAPQPLELVTLGKNRAAALFPKEDEDFCLIVDNSRSERGIMFETTINQKSHGFVIDGQQEDGWVIKALKTNGRKLHFISQDTDQGQILVGLTAAKYGMSYDEAAEMCCQIKFKVDVEKLAVPRPSRLLLMKNGIQVFVKGLVGTILSYMVDLEDTVEYLKYLIYTKEKILPEQQRLVYQGKELFDQKCKLREYDVTRDSTLHLLLSLRGGRPKSCPDELPPFEDIEIMEPKVGSRGVICQGDKSNQKFCSADEFVEDETYKILPFTLELRMVPKYKPI